MKHYIVASLIFLCISILIVSNSCNWRVQKNNTTFKNKEVLKKIDSLNTFYSFADNESNENDKKLQALDKFLNGCFQLKSDSLQYKGLILQTKLLNQYGFTEKAIEKSFKLLELARKNNDSIHIGRAYFKLGLYNKIIENHLEAFEYYNQSFKICRNIKDSIRAGKCLMDMSNIQRSLGDYNASKTTATDGLKYLENSDEYLTIIPLYQSISIIYKELGDGNEALLWNNKIMRLLEDSIIKRQIGLHNVPLFLNTRANIFAKQKKYDEGINILESLIEDKEAIKNLEDYSIFLNNLAYIKFLQNPKNKEIEKMLLKGLKIRLEEKDNLGVYTSSLNLAKYYQVHNLEKAKKHARNAYQIIKDVNDYEAQLEALTLLTELQPNSLEHHQYFKEASLKLMELRKKTREIYAPTRFENESLLKENEKKSLKIAAVRNQNTIYLLGMLLLFFGIGFVIYFFKQQTKQLNQQNKIIQFQASYDTETRIAKRLHDELGNDIFQVMLQYQNDPHDPHISKKLNAAYSRARDISRENNEFETDETYPEELRNMLQNYTGNEVQLIVRGLDKIDWNPLEQPIKITLYRVLQELMTNMQKHSNANLVVLVFSSTDNQLLIKYSDNGIGITNEGLHSKNGLRNTEKRMEAIRGTLTFGSEKDQGFKAELQIPT